MRTSEIAALSLCGFVAFVLGLVIRQHKVAAIGLVIMAIPVNLILLEMSLTLWRMKR